MKTPYIVVGVLFGAVLGILVGGRELGLCAVTWVLTIPSGAAFGYFLAKWSQNFIESQ